MNIHGTTQVQLRLLSWMLLTIILLLLALGHGWTTNRLIAAPMGAPQNDVNVGCINLIQGGDFEQFNPAWQSQGGSRPPTLSIEEAFGGIYSMRIGNGADLPNIENVSEVIYDPIYLPTDATSLILRFVYWSLNEGGPDVGDVQEVDLFDADAHLLTTIPLAQGNAQSWKAANPKNLMSYAGSQVSLRFRVRNDGQVGRALMYIDNVEIEYCAATPIPTFTPSLTPSVTVTPTPSGTPTPTGTLSAATATPTPSIIGTTPTSGPAPTVPTADPACVNILTDPGFEGWSGWHFGEDPVPALYVSEPRVAGTRAVQLGNPPNQTTNVVTFSSIRQLVTLPFNVTRAELRWWKLLQTGQGGAPGSLSDRQDLILLSPSLQPIQILRRELSNAGIWQEDVVDITAYRGQTFYVYFNAFNDGNGARTWMYLDDVQLNLCGVGSTGSYSGNAPAVATPIAIPLTSVATFTPAPIPTSSPSPTQFSLPTATATIVSTATSVAAAALPVAPPPATAILPAIEAVSPTSNVNALATLPASIAVSTETPSAITVPDSSVATAVPPAAIVATPTTPATRPVWIDRLGPISVLAGVLVLISFIVWAILRTFRNSRTP